MTMRSDIKELLSKSLLSLVLRMAGAVVSFVMTMVITRSLGATDSGLFFLGLTIATVLATVSRFGFDQTLTRFVGVASEAKDWTGINEAYRSVIPRVFGLSLLVSCCLFLSSSWISENLFHKPQLAHVLHYMAWLVCINAVCWLHAHAYQGLRDMPRFQWFQNLGIACLFLVTIGIAKQVSPSPMFGLLAFCRVYLICSAAILIAALFGWTRHSWFQWRSLKPRFRELLSVATPLVGVAIMGQVTMWLPQLMLGATHAARDISIYNAANRTAMLTTLVLMACNSIALPQFAAFYRKQELARLRHVMVTSTRVIVVVCFPLLMLLLLKPGFILSVFGSQFSDGATVLRILGLGQFINVATGSVGGLLSMTGHERVLLTGNLIAVVLVSILCIMLIPAYGMSGAAIAQAVALSVQMLFFTWAVRKHFGFYPLTLLNTN